MMSRLETEINEDVEDVKQMFWIGCFGLPIIWFLSLSHFLSPNIGNKLSLNRELRKCKEQKLDVSILKCKMYVF